MIYPLPNESFSAHAIYYTPSLQKETDFVQQFIRKEISPEIRKHKLKTGCENHMYIGELFTDEKSVLMSVLLSLTT